MADKDYRTDADPNILNGCFKLPRIRMPKIFAEDESGRIFFEIETSKGLIKVTSGGWREGFWKCRGDVPSLVAGGFIKPDWCPGLPGNNKTNQTVLFENDNPRLVYGNHRGRKLPAACIVIIRISRNKFEVEVPATKEQGKLISQTRERWFQLLEDARRLREQQELKQKEEKRKEEKRKEKPDRYLIPMFFKDYAIDFVNIGLAVAMNELRGEGEFSEYGETTIKIDEQSIQDILCAKQRLIETMMKAKVIYCRKEPRLSIVNSI